MWKEVAMANFVVISWNFSGGTEEKYRNIEVGPGYQPGCIILRVGNLAD
jgi:hypothetical protein